METAELRSMIAHDETHWWYRGRRRILRAVLDQLPERPDRRLLDAGCGSGRTLDDLADYGTASGVDISELAVTTARSRGHRDVRVGALPSLPFEAGAFDVVTCLDVIEHTRDDYASLRELRRVTRRGGTLIVTVPAYPRLWSRHDEVNQHYRRYTRASLETVARESGWKVARHTYFNSLLLVPAAVVRLLERKDGRTTGSDLDRTPGFLNRLLEVPLMLEARALRAGLRLPAGLSLLAVLENPVVPVARIAPMRRRPGRPRAGSSHGRARTGMAATLVVAALAGPVLAGCAAAAGSGAAPAPSVRAVTSAARPSLARPPAARATRIDRMASAARSRYGEEVHGAVVHQKLRRLAADKRLRRLLASGDDAAVRAYVARMYRPVWYHWHISRLRILRGSQTVAEAGVPFVVAPARTAVKASRGRPPATIEVSIQDVIGYVRFMHRHYPVDLVVRGNGPQHVKTSLPAALQVALPDHGTATIAGHGYRVRSFAKTAFAGEHLKIWVLQRAPGR